MGCISLSYLHQSMSDLRRKLPYDVKGHSWFCLQYPITRPIRTEEEFNIGSCFGIEGKLFSFVVSDSHLIRFDTQSLKPVNTEFFPVCEPFKVCIRFTEEFQFHLFKFSCSESKIAWCDLISERLTDLSDTKWNLLTGCSLDILEINEDTCAVSGLK